MPLARTEGMCSLEHRRGSIRAYDARDRKCSMLHEFIAMNRETIIRRCRAKVATLLVPSPTEAELDHGVPVFLDRLADALRSREGRASPHGNVR